MDRYGLDIKRIDDKFEITNLEDIKTFAGIDFSDADAELSRLCRMARLDAESYCGRCFVYTTVYLYAQYWVGTYPLPYGPITELTSIKDGNEVTITDYKLKGQSFKQLEVNAPQGLYLEYTSNEECPPDAAMAIAMLAACLYDADLSARYKSDAYALLNQFKRAI